MLGRVHTTQSDTDAGEPNKSGKHTVKFVITGTHRPKALYPAEKPLYLIPPLIQLPVILPGLYPIPLRRHDRIEPQSPSG
ncbi:hypothetical protein FACS1894142_4250 [Spirochaetia bacterium]|nr:hypothetical protein FACS1894142_4250 [Spirochaetia bacterium]